MFVTRSVALAATLTAGLVGVAAQPIDAGSSYFSRTTGSSASAYWTQVDGTEPGTSPFGNVHVGYLDAYATSTGVGDVFVFIDDFDCEAGELPGGGGHGVFEDEPPVDEGCAYVGSRFGEGYGLEFTIDKKLDRAGLKGRLTMTQGGGHGEPGNVVGQPPVDMTWTGTGSLSSGRSTYHYREGDTTYSGTYSSKGRQATLGGILGPMSFDPALSGGYISTFKDVSRTRTR